MLEDGARLAGAFVGALAWGALLSCGHSERPEMAPGNVVADDLAALRRGPRIRPGFGRPWVLPG